MEAQDSMVMVTPTLFSLGDLTKEGDQMIIILCTTQFGCAHVDISRSQVGVSVLFFIIFYRDVAYCCLYLLLTTPYYY
jgi:hypothetical protein